MPESNPLTMNDQIQRLIDGDLDDEQYWELLNRIDRESPGHWRTVALGFVEAQSLRAALREEEKTTGATEKVVSFPSSGAKFFSRRTMIAASIALLMGALLGGSFRASVPSQDSANPVLAESGAVESRESVPPSFQAIESIELALRDRGLKPTLSEAFFQADLPDGRKLLLPIQRLSVAP